MKIDYKKPEARIYDLLVSGKAVDDWVMADEETGEYELFVTELPYRGGGKIEDKDNPTGYQTIKQKGKVEFKRNGNVENPTTSSGYNPFGKGCDPCGNYNPEYLDGGYNPWGGAPYVPTLQTPYIPWGGAPYNTDRRKIHINTVRVRWNEELFGEDKFYKWLKNSR